MPIASASKLCLSYGQRVLFDELNFDIDRGERVGLIGDNGSGKTTLFKIFSGQVEPDRGSVSVARTVKVGYLAQDATFDPANTVVDEAELAFARLHELAHRLRELEHDMAEHQDDELQKTLDAYQHIQHEFEIAGGYAWQHKLEATLLGVGLTRDMWEQNVETLSGGQRSRLALAKLLIAQPDVLMLDEPTNHLDIAAIEWLEQYLLEFTGAVLLISHDRYLLDRLATRIVWLTRAQLSSYPGNYSAFVAQRALQELSQQRAYEEQQADIDKQKEFVRRFGAGQRAREAKGREKRLNRLLASDQMIAAVQSKRSMNLQIETDQRAGDQVLRVSELSKSFDSKKLWNDVKIDIRRGERVGIIGPNGSGKTTLLRVLTGAEDADHGKVKWGASLGIGYYDQRLDEFDPENTITEEVREGRPDLPDQAIRDALGAMLFRGSDVDKPMGLLSGGERARVALVELLLEKPNVLLLDEPTNHLDVASCDALENALRDFNGTILCVSHDRYFLDRIVGKLLVIQPPDIITFDGGYRRWVEKKSMPVEKKPVPTAKPQVTKTVKHAPEKKPRKDNPWSRPFGRLTMKELESHITETEIAINEIQQRFGDPIAAREGQAVKTLHAEHKELTLKLEQLEAEYYAREK